MTYELSLLPEVEEDTFVGYRWYEKRSSGLGDQFLEELYTDIGGIPSNPLLYEVVRRRIRCRLLRRFPYAIYFSLEEEQILVLGVFHCARDPQGIDYELRLCDE